MGPPWGCGRGYLLSKPDRVARYVTSSGLQIDAVTHQDKTLIMCTLRGVAWPPLSYPGGPDPSFIIMVFRMGMG